MSYLIRPSWTCVGACISLPWCLRDASRLPRSGILACPCSTVRSRAMRNRPHPSATAQQLSWSCAWSCCGGVCLCRLAGVRRALACTPPDSSHGCRRGPRLRSNNSGAPDHRATPRRQARCRPAIVPFLCPRHSASHSCELSAVCLNSLLGFGVDKNNVVVDLERKFPNGETQPAFLVANFLRQHAPTSPDGWQARLHAMDCSSSATRWWQWTEGYSVDETCRKRREGGNGGCCKWQDGPHCRRPVWRCF